MLNMFLNVVSKILIFKIQWKKI